MSDDVKIEKGVPLPLQPYRKKSPLLKLVESMEIGDSIVVTYNQAKSLQSSYHTFRGGRLSYRQIPGTLNARLWVMEKAPPK